MRITATELWQIKEALREELKEMRIFDPTKEMGAQGLSPDETLYYEPGMEGEQKHSLGGPDNPYEKYSIGENESLEDFWMNELNSALMASMSDVGLANKMLPSDFLEAILPVLQAYGSGADAEEMVAHVRGNPDIYSPRRPAGGGFGSSVPGQPALHGSDVPGFGEKSE